MKKIGVLGAGTWGMALARMLCNAGNEVLVWSALGAEIDQLRETRKHPKLPEMVIPDALLFTKSIGEVCRDKDILLFVGSTLGFTILLGRALCGFLCPMGLIQDLMDKLRRKTRIEGIAPNEKLYKALTPIKWCLVFIFLGLCFVGGNFCNFCPAVAVSPILAGMSASLYVSGFLMVFVLIGGFFKRRLFCTVCPLGFLVGLLHKISLFRIKKDCTACTECGACYEACPMGIKTIYTEREKTDVTDVNCILCGECVRRCPENNALSVTFAGLPIYKASRQQVMSGYETKESEATE